MAAVVHLAATRHPRAGACEGAVVQVRPGALSAPVCRARTIYCHLRPGWRSFALMTSLRAAHPQAWLVLVLDGDTASLGAVGRLLSSLFDAVVPAGVLGDGSAAVALAA